MISRFSPLCWALPANPSFNSKDAQAKQVLAEAGGLQRTIYAKTGVEYAEYLRNNELPGMGMGGDLIEEFLTALSQLDVRGFRQFFPVWISQPHEYFSLSSFLLTNHKIVIHPAPQRINLTHPHSSLPSPFLPLPLPFFDDLCSPSGF